MVILDVIGIVDVFEAQDRGNVDVAIQAAIGLAYYVPLTAGRGATLGKMALGIKVVGAWTGAGRAPGRCSSGRSS